MKTREQLIHFEVNLLHRFHLKELKKTWPHATIWYHEAWPYVYLGAHATDESYSFFYDRDLDTLVPWPPEPGRFEYHFDETKPKPAKVGPDASGRITYAPVYEATIQTRGERTYVIIDNEWNVALAPSNSTLKKYGITDIDYLTMLWKQDGCCAICGRPPKRRRLAIDHDHKKKGRESVRGLLCYSCNYGLGVFRDNQEHLAKASEYLHQPSPLAQS